MTRHASLADQLQALRAYRSRPEPDADLAPVQTNWSVTPANDNNPEEVADLRNERRLEVTPSIDAIMRSVNSGDVERNGAGQIIRIGTLRFSDGTQTERAYTTGPDGKLIQFDARMPAGAMLDTREKAKVDAGGGDNPQETVDSDRYFADMFGVKLTARESASRNKRTGKSYTPDESTAMLAEAWTNTDSKKVTYTKYPAGLPRAGARISDSFVGMKKARCGDTGAMGWEDITTAHTNRDIWASTVAYLNEKDRAALDAACEAKTLADIEPGGSRRAAERRGKRALLAANDNLREALRIFA